MTNDRIFISVLPVPTLDDKHEAVPCMKCSGTGFFCLGILNGQPYSNTGFTCWRCNGTGYFIHTKKVEKAPVDANTPNIWTKSQDKPTWSCEMSVLFHSTAFQPDQDGDVTIIGPTGKGRKLSEFKPQIFDGETLSWVLEIPRPNYDQPFKYVVIND